MAITNSDFTINLYNNLQNEYSGSVDTLKVVPFYLGVRGINLRQRDVALSCSVSRQTSLDSTYDYKGTQRKLDEQILEDLSGTLKINNKLQSNKNDMCDYFHKPTPPIPAGEWDVTEWDFFTWG